MNFINKPSDIPSIFVRMIIRPPRADYEEDHLGPSKFTVNERICERNDLELINDQGLKLKCSHFYQSNPSPSPCVIYLHGNCGCRLDAFKAVSILLRDGISVFCFDFAGSGLSEGKYISLGYYEKGDVKTIVDYLRTLDFITTIGLWGRSMGAATAIMYAASDPSIAGMVLDSPFASLPKLASELVQSDEVPIQIPKVAFNVGLKAVRKQVKRKLKFDINKLTPITYVGSCFAPALFVHAESDKFILPHHGQELYEAYAGEKNIILVEGNHNTARPAFCTDSISIFFHNTLLAGQKIENTNITDPTCIPTLEDLELHKDLPSMNLLTHKDIKNSEEDILQQVLLLSLQEDNNQFDATNLLLMGDLLESSEESTSSYSSVQNSPLIRKKKKRSRIRHRRNSTSDIRGRKKKNINSLNIEDIPKKKKQKYKVEKREKREKHMSII